MRAASYIALAGAVAIMAWTFGTVAQHTITGMFDRLNTSLDHALIVRTR